MMEQQEEQAPRRRWSPKRWVERGLSRLAAALQRLAVAIAHIPYRRIGRRLAQWASRFMHWFTFDVVMPKKWSHASKEQVFSVIFKSDTPEGKKFDVWLLVAIGVNIVLMIVESYQDPIYAGMEDGHFVIRGWFSIILQVLGWVFTIAFTVEYYLRVWCLKNKRRYIFSFYGIIDFFATFPTYLAIFFPSAQVLSVLRILRALRIFRVFKMQRFIDEGAFLLNALRMSLYKILIFMIFVFFSAVILGATMYAVESHVEDTVFTSIPKGIYWAVVTITTVGYGDITPHTSAGQVIAVIVMLLGYSIIAVPTGLVAGSTVEAYKQYRKRPYGLSDIDDDVQDNDEDSAIESGLDQMMSGKAAGTPGDESGATEASRPRLYCRHCGYEEDDPMAVYCKRCGTRLSKDTDRSWINDFFK